MKLRAVFCRPGALSLASVEVEMTLKALTVSVANSKITLLHSYLMVRELTVLRSGLLWTLTCLTSSPDGLEVT